MRKARPTSTRIRFGVALSLAAALATIGCDAGSDGQSSQRARIDVTGSSTIAPLMNEIGKRFEERRAGARIDVQTGGSSRGVADARSGLASVGMVSRALKADESDLLAFTIALDGVCVILHAENPVSELSDRQIVDIYLGRVGNWSEVGGPDAPITVVNKAEGRSTLEIFATHFDLDVQTIEADVVIGDNEQGVKTVAGNAHAIGYVSVGTAQYDRDAGVPIKLLPVNGVEASVENVANGSFPIARPLNLVTSGPPEGIVAELVDFARSEEVHDLIREMSFVPVP